MKSSSVIITNLIILAVGILFLFTFEREGVIQWIIFVSGLMFIIPAIINMVILATRSKEIDEHTGKNPVMKRGLIWACSVGALILGAIMCFNPALFRDIYIYIFAASIFFGGCYHIYMLARGLRRGSMPGWLYALPVILIAAAVVMITVPTLRHESSEHVMVGIIGGSLILFALTTFVELLLLRRKGEAEDETQAS